MRARFTVDRKDVFLLNRFRFERRPADLAKVQPFCGVFRLVVVQMS